MDIIKYIRWKLYVVSMKTNIYFEYITIVMVEEYQNSTRKRRYFFNSLNVSDALRLFFTLERFGTDAVKLYRGFRLTRFGIFMCPIECKEFYYIKGYDGCETPLIDRGEYLKYLIGKHYESNDIMS